MVETTFPSGVDIVLVFAYPTTKLSLNSSRLRVVDLSFSNGVFGKWTQQGRGCALTIIYRRTVDPPPNASTHFLRVLDFISYPVQGYCRAPAPTSVKKTITLLVSLPVIVCPLNASTLITFPPFYRHPLPCIPVSFSDIPQYGRCGRDHSRNVSP